MLRLRVRQRLYDDGTASGSGGSADFLLLEGDMQSGSDHLLLEGDMQNGGDALLLEGDMQDG